MVENRTDNPLTLKLGREELIIRRRLRIPANVTGHSGDRDRFAHGHHAGVDFVL
jgi:hypothetical protein